MEMKTMRRVVLSGSEVNNLIRTAAGAPPGALVMIRPPMSNRPYETGRCQVTWVLPDEKPKRVRKKAAAQ